MICSNCQSDIPEESKFCPYCGHPLNEEASRAGAHTGPQQMVNPMQSQVESKRSGEEPAQGKGIAAFILGIISVACGSFICGIVGIVLANAAKKEGNNSSMQKAGFILSIIGVVVGAIVVLLIVVVLISSATFLSDAGGGALLHL